VRLHVAYGLDRLDRRAAQLHLELEAAPGAVRVDPRRVAAAPREERDLVDRHVPRHRVGLVGEHRRARAREAREAPHERRAERVEVVGPAEVQQVPDHLRARRGRGRTIGSTLAKS
jgi:hypothetical protein